MREDPESFDRSLSPQLWLECKALTHYTTLSHKRTFLYKNSYNFLAMFLDFLKDLETKVLTSM